jgi:hypothetical protein
MLKTQVGAQELTWSINSAVLDRNAVNRNWRLTGEWPRTQIDSIRIDKDESSFSTGDLLLRGIGGTKWGTSKNWHWGSAVLYWTKNDVTRCWRHKLGHKQELTLRFNKSILYRDAVARCLMLSSQWPRDTDWLNKNLQWLIASFSTGDFLSWVLEDTDWSTSKNQHWGSTVLSWTKNAVNRCWRYSRGTSKNRHWGSTVLSLTRDANAQCSRHKLTQKSTWRINRVILDQDCSQQVLETHVDTYYESTWRLTVLSWTKKEVTNQLLLEARKSKGQGTRIGSTRYDIDTQQCFLRPGCNQRVLGTR